MSQVEAAVQPADWNDATETGRLMGGYSEPTLRAWRHRGVGPPYLRVGKHVKYHWPTVEKWMLAQQVTPARGSVIQGRRV